jgi:methyl-accepting chemotaxis protein
MIADAVTEIRGIVTSITVFNDRLGLQNQHIEETVAAVTEMLASIENVTRITENDQRAADQLVDEAERGKEIFDTAFEKVAEITESLGTIQEMASVIAGIASQTNILAMNAAIEAAHAGEFGKGFAVVADEIAKLASASAISSDEIASNIAAIGVKTREAGSIRANTSQAFNNISQRIQGVSDSVSQIHGNIREMQVGSRQILNAMENLRTNSEEITNESARIDHSAQGVGSTMADLGRISHEVTSNISEIAIGMQMITKNVHMVAENAEQIGVIGSKLDAAVSVFKTGESPEA